MTSQPRMCYDVEKILGVSNEGNVRCYKVQWAPVWVSSLHLFGCENLIQEFLQQEEQQQKQQQQKQKQPQQQQQDQQQDQQQQKPQAQQQKPQEPEQLEQQQQHTMHIEPTNIVEGTSVIDPEVLEKDISLDAFQDEGSNFHADINSLHHGRCDDKHHPRNLSMKTNTSQPETFTMVNVKKEVVDAESVDSFSEINHSSQQPYSLQSHQESIYQVDELKSLGIVSATQSESNPSSCENTYEATEQKVFYTTAGFPQSSASYPDMLNEEPEDIYHCETCEKSFSSEKKLQYHKKYTLSCGGQRPAPNKCDYCDARFVSKCHLKVHERTHTKEKPYQCTECDKAFAVKSNLRVHMHIHSGERRFACENCGQTFNQGGNRNQHYKRCIQK